MCKGERHDIYMYTCIYVCTYMVVQPRAHMSVLNRGIASKLAGKTAIFGKGDRAVWTLDSKNFPPPGGGSESPPPIVSAWGGAKRPPFFGGRGGGVSFYYNHFAPIRDHFPWIPLNSAKSRRPRFAPYPNCGTPPPPSPPNLLRGSR